MKHKKLKFKRLLSLLVAFSFVSMISGELKSEVDAHNEDHWGGTIALHNVALLTTYIGLNAQNSILDMNVYRFALSSSGWGTTSSKARLVAVWDQPSQIGSVPNAGNPVYISGSTTRPGVYGWLAAWDANGNILAHNDGSMDHNHALSNWHQVAIRMNSDVNILGDASVPLSLKNRAQQLYLFTNSVTRLN